MPAQTAKVFQFFANKGGASTSVIPQEWADLLRQDPELTAATLVVGLHLNDGRSIFLSPRSFDSADGLHDVQAGLFDQDLQIERTITIGQGSASALSITVQIPAAVLRAHETAKRGMWIAGFGEVFWAFPGYKYENRIVFLRGEVVGGVEFGLFEDEDENQTEIASLTIADPRTQSNNPIPDYPITSERYTTALESSYGRQISAVVNRYTQIPAVHLETNGGLERLSLALEGGWTIGNVYMNGRQANSDVQTFLTWDDGLTNRYRGEGNDTFTGIDIAATVNSNTLPSSSARYLYSDPPTATPTETAYYLVQKVGTGAWAGHDGDMARWNYPAATWSFFTPVNNDQVQLDDETYPRRWTTRAWNGLFPEEVYTHGESEVYVDIDHPDHNYSVVGALRHVLSKFSSLGEQGLDPFGWALAEARMQSTYTPAVLVNGTGSSSTGALDWAETIYMDEFPMISGVWSGLGYSVVAVDARRPASQSLTVGGMLIRERLSGFQELSKERAVSAFTLHYDYRPMDDLYAGTMVLDETNNPWCTQAWTEIGRVHDQPRESNFIDSPDLAAYTQDWRAFHFGLPAVDVEYGCSPGILFYLQLGETFALNEPKAGWEGVRTVFTGFSLRRAQVYILCRVWPWLT